MLCINSQLHFVTVLSAADVLAQVGMAVGVVVAVGLSVVTMGA
jgi:hypothetical protein